MNSYLQTAAAECGLACLGFVAAHHGKPFSMSELRSRFALSIRGVYLSDLIRMGALLGLNARPVRLPLEALPKLATPCILHWDMSHFIVLVKATGKRLWIHDPARGECSMSLAEASPHFTGVALELSPAEAFERVSPRPAVGWRQLIGRVVGLKRSLTQLFLLAVSLQVVALLLPLFTQWLIDGPVVSGNLDLLWVVVTGFVLVTVIRTVLEWTRGWLGIIATQQLGVQWAARVAGHLLKLPMKWFEVRHTGDVLSRFQSMQSIQQAVTGRLVDILLDGALSLLVIAVMLVYSPLLTAIVVIAMGLYGVIRHGAHGKFHRLSDQAMTHEAVAQTHFLESLRAIQAVKLAGLEEQRTSRWSNLMVLAINHRMHTQRMTLSFGAAYGLLFGLETVAVLSTGARMAIEGSLTIGMLMAFITYKDDFSARTQRLIDNVMGLRMLRLHVDRLSDIVLTETERTTGTIPERFDTGGWLPARIELDNVSFRYGDAGNWVLRNVSLSVGEGEHVAIVGATGCGKTTLAKIILGLLEPTEGTVRVGGVPLTQVGLANWRRHVGAVMQDDQLFSGTLRDNIAAFDEQVDLERVETAARLAAIHEDIVAMPMGYHTLNGDMGNTLSGGQRQRIFLARALYRQPPVLVLDEATSHLDVGREREVNQAICSLPVTRITIAHRPETIAMAERVIDLTALAGAIPATPVRCLE